MEKQTECAGAQPRDGRASPSEIVLRFESTWNPGEFTRVPRRPSPPRVTFSCLLMPLETLNGGGLPYKSRKGRKQIPAFMGISFASVKLRGERCSATTAAGRIWVVESESRAHHVRRVIDRDPVQILCRKHVDKETYAVLVHNEIAAL